MRRNALQEVSKHGNPESEVSSFFDCWDWRHQQSDILQRAGSWAHNDPTTVSSAKGCLSVNLSVCSVCPKLGGFDRHLPITFSQYDILC